MIAQALRAAYERVAVSEQDRRPAFLIIDEASEYFDDSLETLLNQVRKFNLGIVFAHQYVDQLSPSLRASVAANTSIKMAGGVSDRDARALSADMRTTPDFLTSQKKDRRQPPQWTQFACHIRNHTSHALSLEISFGVMERAPKMSPATLAKVKALNRARYATQPPTTPSDTPPPGTSCPEVGGGGGARGGPPRPRGPHAPPSHVVSRSVAAGPDTSGPPGTRDTGATEPVRSPRRIRGGLAFVVVT
jgi:hypothetical protein